MLPRNRSFVVTRDTPCFRVRYVGRRQTFTARGKGCTQKLMQDMWDLSSGERRLERAELAIGPSGLQLTRGDDGSIVEAIAMPAITYCSLDRAINGRLFSWVHVTPAASDVGGGSGGGSSGSGGGGGSGGESRQLWCTTVLADSVQEARAVASALAKMFHLAYNDYQCVKRSIVRRQTSKTTSLIALTPPASPKAHRPLSEGAPGSTTSSGKGDGGGEGRGSTGDDSDVDWGGDEYESFQLHRLNSAEGAAANGERLNGVSEITLDGAFVDCNQ